MEEEKVIKDAYVDLSNVDDTFVNVIEFRDKEKTQEPKQVLLPEKLYREGAYQKLVERNTQLLTEGRAQQSLSRSQGFFAGCLFSALIWIVVAYVG